MAFANDNFSQISNFDRHLAGRQADFRRNAIIFARILVVTVVVLGTEWYERVREPALPSIDLGAQQDQ